MIIRKRKYLSYLQVQSAAPGFTTTQLFCARLVFRVFAHFIKFFSFCATGVLSCQTCFRSFRAFYQVFSLLRYQKSFMPNLFSDFSHILSSFFLFAPHVQITHSANRRISFSLRHFRHFFSTSPESA